MLKVFKQLARNKYQTTANESDMPSGEQGQSDFQKFMPREFGGREQQKSVEEAVLVHKLNKLCDRTELSFDQDVFKYFDKMKDIDKDVHELAVTALSAPCTQASVERAFSALALFLSNKRMKIDEQVLDDLMVINLNKELYPYLDFEHF